MIAILRATLPWLVLLVLSIGCDAQAKTPGKRVVEALELVRDGKQRELDDYIMSANAKRQGGQALFMVLSGLFKQNGGASHFEIERESINGEQASVTCRFHFKNGKTDHSTFPLMREDGKWRIRL